MVHRLDVICVRTLVVAELQVAGVGRGAQHHHGQRLQRGVAADLAQRFTAVVAGRVQVHQNQCRQRIAAARRAAQQVQAFLPGAGTDDLTCHAAAPRGVLDGLEVLVRILDDQNVPLAHV